MGIVVDNVSASGLAAELGVTLQLTPEQIGLKAGMLITALFPLLGTVVVLLFIRKFKHKTSKGIPTAQ
jgi:hypothetical protein